MRQKIKLGLIGCGGIAEFSHLPGISSIDNVELMAVCDIVGDRAKKVAEKYCVKEYYLDYMEMLKKADVEAVDICTPVFLHAPITIAAANAGKHVLVEKPMARNSREAQSMVEACNKNDVKLSVMFNMRYMPVNVEIGRQINRGALGKIYMVRIRDGHSGPEAVMPNMASWIFDKEKSGGGCVIDEVHTIDLLCWWLGDVDSVSSELGTLSKKINVEDNAAVTFRFKNGAIGVMEISWSQTPTLNSTEFYGEKGAIIAGDTLRIYTKDVEGWFSPDLPSESYWYWHRLQIRDFADALLKGKQVPVPGEVALARHKIIDSIYLANEKKATIKVI